MATSGMKEEEKEKEIRRQGRGVDGISKGGRGMDR